MLTLQLGSDPGQIRTERPRHNLGVRVGPDQQRSIGVHDRVQNVVGAWAGHRQAVEQDFRGNGSVSPSVSTSRIRIGPMVQKKIAPMSPFTAGVRQPSTAAVTRIPVRSARHLLAVLDLGVAHPFP